MPKFIQSLDNQVYAELERLAKARGITVQTLIRAVIVPEWSSITGADLKHERANLIEPAHTTLHPGPSHTTTSHTSHQGSNGQQSNQPLPSPIFHLRHLKPSTLYEDDKENEKEKADILVYGRKRRHH